MPASRFATFAPQTSYGEQMARTLESHVAVRGGTVVGRRTLRPQQHRSSRSRPGGSPRSAKGDGGKLAVLVPVAPPRFSTALASLAADGLDGRAVQLIGTGVWDVPGIGTETMLRGAWYAAPDPAKRADFERRFVSTYGRPPHRLATLAYDGVALAGHLARLKPGGDFSAEAITNPQRLVRRRRHLPLPARRPLRASAGRDRDPGRARRGRSAPRPHLRGQPMN